MAILHWNDVEERQLNNIIRGRIVKTDNVMACRITAKTGSPIKTHTHEFDQITHMIRGKLKFHSGDEEHKVVQAGDVMIFPAGTPHGGEVLEEAEYIDMFSPPNPDFQWDK